MTGPYDGRAAIVVGAAGSVGGAIAARLAKEGADVVLADIGSDHLESVAARIGVTSRARAVEIDLADNASVESAVAQALEFLGHLDIVVDAAGISHQGRTFDEESPEGFAQVVSVNLTGAYLLAKATVGHLPPGSDLVFIGSSGADAPLPVNFAYGASKAGMHHLTKSLAVALADRRIRVNCVSPGALDAPMGVHGLEKRDSSKYSMVVGRLGTADDIASMVSYVLSDEAAFVNGAILTVDGAGRLR